MIKTNCRNGFLLLELLIGLLLFFVFMYLMYLYQAQTIQTNYEAIHRYKALMRLNSFIATLIYQPELLNQKEYVHADGTIQWSYESFPFETPKNPSLISKARRLHLTITWLGWHQEKRQLSLSTGIVVV